MLSNIKLENFRNHKSYNLDLDKITVLIGRNGVGKTNILEAIVFLSFCRSFREEDKKNIISYDSDYARITGDDLELFFSRFPRLIMKAKERGIPRKISEFIGILPSVIFSPETISIISGSPGSRRRFLDIMISQVDREYLESLMEYKKVRAQRNSLLQRISNREASENELDFWDKELVKKAEFINKKREAAVLFLNKLISGFYQEISGDASNSLTLTLIRNYEGGLVENLKLLRRREVAYGGTIIGPHRDDLQFLLNNHNMINFASRGEMKSAILALKVSELKFLENHRGDKENSTKPLLLLDDIFSEFDPIRRSHLSKLIFDYQAVITSTEKEHLSPDLLKMAKVVELG